MKALMSLCVAFALVGSVYAAPIKAIDDQSTVSQATGSPPDCKKTPNDPRCKDKN